MGRYSILLGLRITIYTDHKNIVYENFTTVRFLYWRLMLEEYGPIFKQIEGSSNDAVYAFRRLPLINSHVTEREITTKPLAEIYCLDKLDGDILSLTYQRIEKYQWKDQQLLSTLKHAIYHNVKHQFMAPTAYYGLVQYRPMILQYYKILAYYWGIF